MASTPFAGPVLLYGAAGFAAQMLDILQTSEDFQVKGFIDAINVDRHGKYFCGLPILGGEEVLESYDPATTGLFLAFGTHEPRIALFKRMRIGGWQFPRCIHATAVISPAAEIEEGVVVGAFAIVGPGCKVGFGSIINDGAVISHETSIGQYVQICPNASIAGRCRIDDEAFIGIGAATLPDIHIGLGSTVGAGAVIIRAVSMYSVVAGVPATEKPQKP